MNQPSTGAYMPSSSKGGCLVVALHWPWPLGDRGFDLTAITTVSWFCPGSRRQLPWQDWQETLKAHVAEAAYFAWLKCGWQHCEPLLSFIGEQEGSLG